MSERVEEDEISKVEGEGFSHILPLFVVLMVIPEF